MASEHQVSFPVPRHRSILDRGRALADRHGIDNSAVIVGLLRMVARTTHGSGSPQMRLQFLLQRTPCLNVKATIVAADRKLTHL